MMRHVRCAFDALMTYALRTAWGQQGVNFTAYQEFKKAMLKFQPQFAEKGELPSYQTLVLGLVSGAMGPCSNAPIDTSQSTWLSFPLPST